VRIASLYPLFFLGTLFGLDYDVTPCKIRTCGEAAGPRPFPKSFISKGLGLPHAERMANASHKTNDQQHAYHAHEKARRECNIIFHGFFPQAG